MNGIRLDVRYNRVNGWVLGLFGMGRRFSSVVRFLPGRLRQLTVSLVDPEVMLGAVVQDR